MRATCNQNIKEDDIFLWWFACYNAKHDENDIVHVDYNRAESLRSICYKNNSHSTWVDLYSSTLIELYSRLLFLLLVP